MELSLSLLLVVQKIIDEPIVAFVFCVSTLVIRHFFICRKNNRMVFLLFALYWFSLGIWAYLLPQLNHKQTDLLIGFFTAVNVPIIILTLGLLLEELQNRFND